MNLKKALPAESGYEAGYRDALDSIQLSLLVAAQVASQQSSNAAMLLSVTSDQAIQTALDAYANNAV